MFIFLNFVIGFKSTADCSIKGCSIISDDVIFSLLSISNTDQKSYIYFSINVIYLSIYLFLKTSLFELLLQICGGGYKYTQYFFLPNILVLGWKTTKEIQGCNAEPDVKPSLALKTLWAFHKSAVTWQFPPYHHMICFSHLYSSEKLLEQCT